jgi:diguanylate cyclase (GGDEF)-like protein
MGDSALKEVANIMLENLRRSNDMVFRVGGEEFGGIILGASKEVIEERLNTIQTALCSANIEHRSSEVARHLTASIGAVISQPMEVCHGFENQFFEADRALYDCKSKGRNCISVVEM